jgi:hypothetical protein
MTGHVDITEDGRSVTIRIPMAFRKRGGRKLVIAPDNQPWVPRRARIDNTLVKALARAYRWKRMFERGEFGSIAELARAEKVNESYLCRILRLTLLAPEIVEAILDGRQPATLQLDQLVGSVPLLWVGQQSTITRRCDRH